MADALIDYVGGGATAVQTGAARFSYPFLRNQIPDSSTKITERDYIQLRASYAPTLTVPPPTDASQNPAGDGNSATSYLIGESPLRPTNIANLVRFTRTYANIPGTQYEPVSRLFERPVMHDIRSGSTYAVSFDDGRTSTLFASRKAVSAVGTITANTKTVAGSNPYASPAFVPDTWGAYPVQIRGGSITQTFFTNSTAGIIQTICQTGTGLTVNVSKSNTEINIRVTAGTLVFVECTDNNVELDADENNITLRRRQTSARTQVTETYSLTENYTVPQSLRTITSAAHGGNAGDRVVLWNGDKVVATSIVYSASGSAFTIPLADLPGNDYVATHCQFAKNGTRYVNGAVDCSARIVSRFYLPGVTVGISNLADVPNFQPVTDPVSWLATIIAYAASPSEDTYAVVETAALESWLGGPIVMKQVTEVQLSDVLKTVDATA